MRQPSLVVVSAFPPCIYTAGENFTRYLLLDLAAVYSITVYYFSYHGHEPAPEIVSCPSITLVEVPLTLSERVWNTLRHPLTHPLFSARLLNGKVARQLLKIGSTVPILYNFSQVFEISRHFPNNPSLFLCHDVISQKVGREKGPLRGIELAFARLTERRVLSRRSSKVFTLSTKDAELLGTEYGVVAAPLSIYFGEEIRGLDIESIELSSEICMFGAWSRPENLEGLKWSIANLLPSLTKQARVRIIGMIKDVGVIQDLKKMENVVVSGFLKNPYPIIAASCCLLAPIFRGAGIKLKVVESLACGTPVISSDVGFEGIDFPKDGLSTRCSTADEYIDATLKALPVSLPQKQELRKWFLGRHTDRNLRTIVDAIKND